MSEKIKVAPKGPNVPVTMSSIINAMQTLNQIAAACTALGSELNILVRMNVSEEDIAQFNADVDAWRRGQNGPPPTP